MNNSVKYVIGATLGSAVGYFVGQVIVEAIHMREVDNHDTPEFDPNIEEETKPMSREKKKEKKLVAKQSKIGYERMFKENPEVGELIAKYKGEAVTLTDDDIVDLDDVGEKLANEISQDMSDTFNKELERDTPGDISIITMEEYANAEDIERVTFHYYSGDDITVDESDNPIRKVEELIGEEALVSFDEDDVVYVHNRLKKCMYEVVRLHQSYSTPRGKEKLRGKKGFDYNEESDDA